MTNFKNSDKMKALTFSFDDGVVQDIRMIELLNKYGMKGTFNLNSEKLGKARTMVMKNGQRICHYKIAPQEVKDTYAGHEVAVHTLTHPHLYDMPDEELIRQVEEDRKNLEALVGYDIVGMAYPFGDNDERIARVIRENTKIRYARVVKLVDHYDEQEDLLRFYGNGRMHHFDRLMEMADEFIAMKPDKKQIFYIWGHTYEMDIDSSYWYRFEEFLKKIAGHEDIYYGTNAEVLL